MPLHPETPRTPSLRPDRSLPRPLNPISFTLLPNPACLYSDPQIPDLAQPRAAAVAPAAVSPCVFGALPGVPQGASARCGLGGGAAQPVLISRCCCYCCCCCHRLPTLFAPQHPHQPGLRVSAPTNWAATECLGGSEGGVETNLAARRTLQRLRNLGLRGTRGRGFSSWG